MDNLFAVLHESTGGVLHFENTRLAVVDQEYRRNFLGIFRPHPIYRPVRYLVARINITALSQSLGKWKMHGHAIRQKNEQLVLRLREILAENGQLEQKKQVLITEVYAGKTAVEKGEEELAALRAELEKREEERSLLEERLGQKLEELRHQIRRIGLVSIPLLTRGKRS